jgi:hypothetical protein
MRRSGLVAGADWLKRIRTLASYVEALGGRLEIIADFGEISG